MAYYVSMSLLHILSNWSSSTNRFPGICAFYKQTQCKRKQN